MTRSYDLPGFDTEQGKAFVLAMSTERPEGVTLDELRLRYMAARGPVWIDPITATDPHWMSTHPGKSFQGDGGVTHEFAHAAGDGPRTRCRGGHLGADSSCDITVPNIGDGQSRWLYQGPVAPPLWDLNPTEIHRLAAEATQRAREALVGIAPADRAARSLAPVMALLDREDPAVPDIVLIEAADELDVAEGLLRDAFAEGGEHVTKSVGFQGGQAESLPLFWHEAAGIWGCIDGLPDDHTTRFWNAFGTQDPRTTGGLSITCEINPAREGVNGRVAGAFGRNTESGHRLLLHRGRIGGGRAGVGQELFWSQTALPAVAVADDPAQRFVIVADLDGDQVVEEVAAFVREVERIKALADHAESPELASGRYGPLAEWLSRQTDAELQMTFEEIEEIVGPLPASARNHPGYWYGRSSAAPTHTWKRAWESGGYTVRTVQIPSEEVTFRRLDATSPVASAPRYWWVNQRQTYDREMPGAYVWAPVRARNGQELAHHRAVSELQVGDVLLHYARGIRAVGRVAAPPEFSRKPDEITEDDWADEGRLCRVDYDELDTPIALDEVPVTWRIEEGGPFNSTGGVNQAYMFPLSVGFVRRLAGRIPELADLLGIEPAPDSGVEVHVPVTDLATIGRAIRDEGLRIDDRTLRRYHLAVQARGFVILSGISGTGKTWLAEAYARAVHGELLLVPVAPNWNTNEDLLGYLNPIDGAYHDTTFSRFVRAAAAEWAGARAENRPARPFFLVLDEMNLARVEYYFAQFLSALEVRARSGEGMLHLGHEEVPLGGNLKFVGTVNIDETTHGFADKVYDRAQLIELAAPREALAAHIGDVPYAADLLGTWDVLHGIAPFAFRVVDEIANYVAASAGLGVSWTDALDEQLLQKVLPKVRGLDPAAGAALEAFIAFADAERYPLSHTKATEMLARFNLHGSVSFFS